MKKIIGSMILIILLFYNYSFAVDTTSWYERYEYDSEEIQELIAEKEKIQTQVNVEPQEGIYDLVIFMGQSNMVGKGGDASKAVERIDGAGYELEFNQDGTIKGLKQIEEPFGEGTNNTVGGSMVTAFMNAYYNNSGTPVIGIAAAYNGTSIYDFWQEGQDGLVNAQVKVEKATKWLEENGYKIRHKYMVWNQGEADVSKIEYIDNNNEKQTYERALKNTIEGMQEVGIERCFMIRIGAIYLYKGYEEKYQERYYEYLQMVNEQTRIAENSWITLISSSMLTLSKCEKMMTDMVHFNQEALDIIGSEAGKNAGQYADATRRKTFTQNQSDRLINFAKKFAKEGFEKEKLVYGILSKYKAYELQLVHYPSPYTTLTDGTQFQVIYFGAYGKEYGWNGEKTQEEFVPNNYIGLDCSGFIAFLYHHVFGLPFDYEYNGRKQPWTTEQFIENYKMDTFDGNDKVNTFKVVYEQHRVEQTYTLNDLATVTELQPGDLLVGRGGKEDNTNHIVMYIGKDENGVDKIIHATSAPALYDMYVEDEDGNRKYYYIGETDLANSTFKYKNVYVLRLNEGILPEDYIYNDKAINWEDLNTESAYDNLSPEINIKYSTIEPTRENVIVTIESNEEIQEVEGWILSNDKKTLTKEYTENIKEIVTIKDLAGNEVQANIEITNIGKIEIGDINQDGKIDVTDCLMLKRHMIAGSRESWKLTGDSLLASDMNKNGMVDITDMLMLKRIIVEGIK